MFQFHSGDTLAGEVEAEPGDVVMLSPRTWELLCQLVPIPWPGGTRYRVNGIAVVRHSETEGVEVRRGMEHINGPVFCDGEFSLDAPEAATSCRDTS